MEDIIEDVKEYIKFNLELENCMQIREVAERYEHSDLVASIDNYVHQYFLQFVDTISFLDASFDYVSEICGSHLLCIKSKNPSIFFYIL